MHYFALLGAVGVHALLFHRDRLRTVVLLSIGTLALNAPWMVWFFSNSLLTSLPGVYKQSLGTCVGSFLLQTVKHIFPPVVLAAAVLTAIWAKRKRTSLLGGSQWQSLALLGLVYVFDVLVLSLTTPAPFFRCLVVVIPVCCAVAGLIMERIARLTHALVGAAVLLATVWSVGSVPGFAYELTHRYQGPVEGIVGYLNENGSPNDLVVITYEDLPLKFYTKMRVIGALTGESLTDITKADWVVLRKREVAGREYEVFQFVTEKIPIVRGFRAITLDGYPDIMNENREDPYPDQHRFRTDTRESPVVIYRRIAR